MSSSASSTIHRLNTHWDEDIVEARVTINVNRLNDLLRLVTEASNRHEEEIDKLKKSVGNHDERLDKIEKDIDAVKPDGDKQKAVDTAIDQLTIQLERLKRDHDHKLETAMKQNRQQHEGFDDAINNLRDDLMRQTVFLKEATSKNATLIQENQNRLDAIRIPDVTQLHADTNMLKSWKNDANDRLLACTRFVRLWGVTRDNLEKLCGGKNSSVGVGGEVEPATMAGTTAASEGTSNRASPVSPQGTSAATQSKENGGGGDKTSGKSLGNLTGIEAERTEYLHSLPAFDLLWTQINKVEKKTTEYIDYKAQVLGNKLTEKIGKHEIAELANELKESHNQVRQTVDFLDRRLRETDELQGRVVKAEEKIKYLHQNKAEGQALDLKADVAIVQQVTAEVVEIRDDINDIFGRLQAGGAHTARQIDDSGSVLSPSARGRPSITGSLDPRRMSINGGDQPTSGGNTPNTSNALTNKRFVDFAEMIASLERRKADKSELNPLMEYIEKLEGKVTALNTAVIAGGGIAGKNLQNHTPHNDSHHGYPAGGASRTSSAGQGGRTATHLSTDSLQGSRPGSAAVHAGGAAAPITPTKPGDQQTRGRSPGVRSPKDDENAHPYQSPSTVGGTDGLLPPRRPGTGQLSSRRLNSAGSRNSPNGLGDSRVDGHSVGTPLETEIGDARVRPFLGRGLVGVRGSDGASVPATIGFHKPQYVFKSVAGSASNVAEGDEGYQTTSPRAAEQ